MSLQSINDPRHWYDRAAEMRALAETMANEETKAIMEITGVKFARSPFDQWPSRKKNDAGLV